MEVYKMHKFPADQEIDMDNLCQVCYIDGKEETGQTNKRVTKPLNGDGVCRPDRRKGGRSIEAGQDTR